MRIVFIGTVNFSAHCLKHILDRGGDVVAVFTLPPGPKRYNADYADLAPIAKAHGVPLYHMKKVSDPDTEDAILAFEPDVIFIFGLSQLIKERLLNAPPLGCIGSHPTLLPKNRGRHPLIWPIVNGEEESGLTFFFMTPGVDDGDILWQERFPIAFEDDAQSLYGHVKELATEAIDTFLPQLQSGTYPRTPQNEDDATYCRKRGEDDGLLRWQKPTRELYNLIRAITHPYVGAHTFAPSGQRVLIWRATPLDIEPHEPSRPGEILSVRDDHSGFTVRTGDGALEVTEWSCEDDAWHPQDKIQLPTPPQNTQDP